MLTPIVLRRAYVTPPGGFRADDRSPPRPSGYSKILVPIDGTDRCQAVLAEASSVARASGARVVLMHIVDAIRHINGFERPGVYIHEVLPTLMAAGAKVLSEAKRTLIADGLLVDTVLIERHGECLADLIVEQAVADEADLILLGTRAKRGLQRFCMGSDAEEVVRKSPMPVLFVHVRDKDIETAAD